jgi:prolipoprotein diacylglyceryltransferase
MVDFKMLYIFSLGMVLTLLYYLEDIIEKQEYKEKSLGSISFLAFIKSLLGGILIILFFYTLEELKLEFVLFSMHFKLDIWGNLLIAGTLSLFGSDMFKILKRRAEIVTEKGVDK